MEALVRTNDRCKKKGVEEVTLSPIYRFIKGDTHVRGKPERRGRQPLLSKGDMGALDRACKRLLNDVDGARAVTHAEI